MKKLISQLVKCRKRWLFAAFDVCIVFAVYLLTVLIGVPLSSLGNFFGDNWLLLLLPAAFFPLLFLAFGVYSVSWVYCSARECIRLIVANVLALAAELLACVFFFPSDTAFKVALAAGIISVGALVGFRFLLIVVYKIIKEREKAGQSDSKRVLVIGAGALAVVFLRDNAYNENLHHKIVGIIDDDPKKYHQKYYGATVLGNRNDIERIVTEQNVDLIVFAIYKIDQRNKSQLLEICGKTGKKVLIMKGIDESLRLDGEGHTEKYLHNVEIEDLLDREPIKLDNTVIGDQLRGKVVMVTGGGGSIGSELCRQICRFEPERLVIFDIYENTTYELQNELEEKFPGQKLSVLIGSVREKQRLDEVMEKYKPWIVFHAAAHKHVPLMEYSPAEAIKNNVFGTYNTARSAAEHGVHRFVMISTDKAVNPTNVMGASKRMCEMVVQTMQKCTDTEFVAVRFGNVLGSHGSVIPRFRRQIEAGGPVTVTHPDITRFFMTIPEAAQLVLQAAAYAKGGEIFVLNMGKPVRIYDLAKNMISLSGLRVDEDIKIVFTGLRPGEKLYEELLMNEEGLQQTAHAKIFIGQPIDITPEQLQEKLAKLEAVLHADEETVKNAVADVVPTYKRNKQD